jgi:uncharacterized membrane protein
MKAFIIIIITIIVIFFLSEFFHFGDKKMEVQMTQRTF